MIKELCLDYFRCLRNIFRIKWRMSKYDFCRFMTVHFFVCLPLIVWFFKSTDSGQVLSETIRNYFFRVKFQNFWGFFIPIATVIPYLAMVHRLQDRGKSGFKVMLYILAALLGYILCLFGTYLCVDYVLPLQYIDGCVVGLSLTEYDRMISLKDLWRVVCSRVLFFVVFILFACKWFFTDGELKDNKFGKAVGIEQNKVNRLFLLLALLFAVFALFLLWASLLEVICLQTAHNGCFAEPYYIDRYIGRESNL